ncbi:hypothetical protein [Streptomyces roseochromogenus]|uniref:Uncharacterized protein n=1 Tax=Streptomyces roseochromogenus subsp. oscitans DS 12.976 TaxID=1352936 RepID=V6KLJ6_STRRC|nr:hypothetical protein [Streptomyces roseochromogenus]EST32301.1 hypothetical protein M878_15310 [Streptomyces roseochromogenus subsp. oscitans DS 12.976]
MNHTYRPLSLLPAAGQERTYALIIAGVPLLLILLTCFLPRLASDSGGSASTAVDGQGGYSYQPPSYEPSLQPSYDPSSTAPVTPDFSTAPTSGTDATTGLSPSPAGTGDTTGTAGADDPGATVTKYFAAINSRDFQTAWDLGGKNLDSSYSAFVSGFEGTERDDFTVGSVDGTTVSVSLVATQTDGTHKSYSGRYTVVDGVITDASLTPAG